MSRADYAHWNEEQDMVWWAEEGKHSIHVDHYDNDDDDYLREAKEDDYDDDTDDSQEETVSDHSGS